MISPKTRKARARGWALKKSILDFQTLQEWVSDMARSSWTSVPTIKEIR